MVASNKNWVVRCSVGSLVPLLALGIVAPSFVWLQENQFEHREASNPWLYGIVINSGMAGVFLVPLGIIVGRVAQMCLNKNKP